MKRAAMIVGAMVVACLTVLQAQAPVPNMSPIIGVWRVDVAKSTYFPGPRPAAAGAAQTRNYVDRGAGLIAEVRVAVTPDGAVAFGGTNVWSGKFDGVDYPAYNLGALLTFLESSTKPMPTRSYKVVDPYTLEQTAKTGAVVNAVITTVVSRDGKTFTETVKANNGRGQQNAQNVIVYDRQ
jgi:hypothetical protein